MKNVKRILVATAAICIAMLVFIFYNFSQINFIEPINVMTFNGWQQHIERWHVEATSPLGRTVNIPEHEILTNTNSRVNFVKRVTINIPYLDADVIDSFVFYSGATRQVITRAQVSEAPIINNARVINISANTDYSFGQKLFALFRLDFFYWVHSVKLPLLVTLWVLFTALIIYKCRFVLQSLFKQGVKSAGLKNVYLLLPFLSACVLLQWLYFRFFQQYGALKLPWLAAFSFYGTFYFIGFALLLALKAYIPRYREIILMLTVLFICIFVGDTTLRLLNINKTYHEVREGYYQSFFFPFVVNGYHTRIPNEDIFIRNVEYKFPRKINSDGFADKMFSEHKDSGVLRILTLGDSFTEGDGADKDSTYPKFCERYLMQNCKGVKIEFYNAGVSGSDVVYEYKLLADRLLKYQPDIVVMAVNNSDYDDLAHRGGFERFDADGKVKFRNQPKWEYLYAQSYILRAILNGVVGMDFMFNTPARKQQLTKEAHERIIDAIGKTQELSNEAGFKLLVVLHPFKSDFKYGPNRVFTELKPNLIKKVDSLNLFDAYTFYAEQKGINRDNVDPYYWVIDGHHNARGYQLMGESIGWKLQTMLNCVN